MAYALHIARADDSPIALGDWRTAVEATEGVRLFADAELRARNPNTGEDVVIRTAGGDTEMFFPDDGQWALVFHWFEGSATFGARFDLDDESHPIWRAAVALAGRVGAVIHGDDGDWCYDPQAGAWLERAADDGSELDD